MANVYNIFHGIQEKVEIQLSLKWFKQLYNPFFSFLFFFFFFLEGCLGCQQIDIQIIIIIIIKKNKIIMFNNPS